MASNIHRSSNKAPTNTSAKQRQWLVLLVVAVVAVGVVWAANQALKPPIVTLNTTGVSVSPSGEPSGVPSIVANGSSFSQSLGVERDVWTTAFAFRAHSTPPVNFEWVQVKTPPMFAPENQTVRVNGSTTQFIVVRYTNDSVATTTFERTQTTLANGSVVVKGTRTSCTQTPPNARACGTLTDENAALLAQRQADQIRTWFFGFNQTQADQAAILAQIPAKNGALWLGTKTLYGQTCERYLLSGDLDDCFDQHGWILWLRGPSLNTTVRILP